MELRVYYEDTDLSGFVYHARYLHFCERARSELFFAHGLQPVWEGYHFVVHKLQARYLHPARLGDLLRVKTYLASLKRSQVGLYQQIVGEAGRLLFEMEIDLVCLKGSRPARIPPPFLDLLAKIPPR
ncbi:MAG: acyl-CoA thioester hydrolase [Nitratiruptor sp.]|nr:acyl-CoA thioester hydrolase [Nitratiruptor sp.]NPA83186.1 YbgC/FadM family acyl-CoA thioesterase [Campylobacterota bacterium]